MPDGLTILTLSSIEDLDPVIVGQWQRALQGAIKDCQDRPGEKGSRKVVLEMTIKPVTDVVGTELECIGVEAELAVKTGNPAHVRGGKNLAVYSNGECAFNPMSPHNAQQRTLPIREATEE